MASRRLGRPARSQVAGLVRPPSSCHHAAVSDPWMVLRGATRSSRPLTFRPRGPLLGSPRGDRGGLAASRAAVGYALLAAVATALALALRDGFPWVYPTPWMTLGTAASLATSAVLGVTLAVGMIGLTRLAVARFGWARRLHGDLRPVAREL